MKQLPIILIMSVASVGALATEYHIAAAGNDGNPGSADKPFATLEKARDAMRGQGGGDVVVHGGTYTLTRPFVLTPQDSGTKEKPVRYVAAKDETPVFTSAREITGWKKHDANIWVADVPKGWRFHFLYVNGQPQPVARMSKTGNWHSWPKVPKVGPIEPAGQLLTFAPGLLDGLPGNGDLEMNFMPVVYWNGISVLRDLNAADNSCRRHSKNPTVFRRSQFRQGNFNLLNALKFLSQPGEWCVDSAVGKVYWWPVSGTPVKKTIWASTLYRLLETTGTDTARVHDIEIRGLTFTCSDRLPEDQWPEHWTKRQAELPDAMIFLEGVENVLIADNVISWSGSYGVALEKFAQNVRIIRNEIAYPGCGGVQLQGYGPGSTDVNKNNIIRRNLIHHTGNGGYLHSAAITLYQIGSNDISLNWLDRMPYAAIQIVGAAFNEFGTGKPAGAWDSYGNLGAMYQVRWNEIPGGKAARFTRQEFKKFLHSGNNRLQNNVISNYLETMADGGALYCWGCGEGNLWQGNLLRRDKTHAGEKWCCALYMDDHVDGATVENNLCWHKGYRNINKGANKWTHNVVQATKPADYDTRLKQLLAESANEGGWLRDPQNDGQLGFQMENRLPNKMLSIE